MVLRPDQFTEQAQEVLHNSQELVRRYSHSQWDVEHILLARAMKERLATLEEEIARGREELEGMLG